MAEICKIDLDYIPDLIEYYHKFADLPGFVLLESLDRSRGRYDILSAFPYEQLDLSRTSEHPDAYLKHLNQKISSRSVIDDLPFQGGAIGYFSYDLASTLAGISPLRPSALPEGSAMAEVGLYDWAIITDHYLKKVTLLAVNEHPSTPLIVKEVLARWQGKSRVVGKVELHTALEPLICREEYNHSFAVIQQALKLGRCYQVNYTQPFNGHYSGDNWTLYQQIRLKNPVPFAAFIRGQSVDLLSFSPERFILMDQRQLLTSPIKGTEKRSADVREDQALMDKLSKSEKNRAENIMIVDMMRNDFGRIAKAGTVKVSKLCELQSFSAVHHLVSFIEAHCIDSISPLEAFLSCFPGASITGAPKLEAMRVIHELERYSRGPYCGSIGYFSAHGRFDTNIAIRTLLAKNNTLSLSAGGGIVIDSDCDEEYKECLTKIAAINKGLESIEKYAFG